MFSLLSFALFFVRIDLGNSFYIILLYIIVRSTVLDLITVLVIIIIIIIIIIITIIINTENEQTPFGQKS